MKIIIKTTIKTLIATIAFFAFNFSAIGAMGKTGSIGGQNNQAAQIAIYKSIYKINQLSTSNYPPQVMYKFIKSEILPLFDFNYMSQKITQNYPNSHNKTKLINSIKQDIVNTIMQNLYKLKGNFFTPTNIKRLSNNIAIRLKVRGINLDLMMHSNNNKWQIFDVLINNQSLIIYYQQKLQKAVK